MTEIRFGRGCLGGDERGYVEKALDRGEWTGDGEFGRLCERLLEREVGSRRVLLAPSCTVALEVAASLLDIRPGDEVILPSFTFASTANAFVLRGARPVFVDVRPDTLNLNESLLEGFVTDRTRAIVPVHYAGVGCEMDIIGDIAARHGIPVVEDNAQGLFGKYRGRPLGSFGLMSAVSFHGTKNFTCGEGGALFLNDERLIERAEIIREKGTDRARFLRGEVDKYTWRDVGSSCLLPELLAAFLYAQLESRQAIQAVRRGIWETYRANLAKWSEASGARLPVVPRYCDQTYHMFYLLLPTAERRDEFIGSLKRRGIQSVSHYEPLHLSPMAHRWGYRAGDLPVAEDVAARLVRLPFHNGLTEEEQARVCEAAREASRGWR